MYVYGHTHSKTKSIDQPGKVADPARGQLNGKIIFPCLRSCLIIWSRETVSVVPSRVSLLISMLGLNLVLIHGIQPGLHEGVHLLCLCVSFDRLGVLAGKC